MARGLALIVDDSSTARIILARVLAKLDILSTGVPTAEAALHHLRDADEERPDVIFLDHLLPGMDGFDALKELKKRPDTQGIPVFMYTSQGADRYIEQARSLGAAGVIGKQIDREQLYRRLSGILATQYSDIEDATEIANRSAPEANPNAVADMRQLRRFTGRLSTLEIAYEEANDELRHFRQELAILHVEYSRLQRMSRRNVRVGSAVISALVVMGLVQFFQFGTVSDSLASIQAQFRDVEAVVSALVDLSN